VRERVRNLQWRYPEWWCLALSAMTWTALCGRALLAPAAHHPMAWPEELSEWLLMVIAMMLPLVIGSVRLTAYASLWRRRDRAIAGFAAGFLGPWLAAGAIVAALDPLVNRVVTEQAVPLLPSAGFVGAAVWQLGPIKRRALVSCHQSVPLAPRGWRADKDCVRFGWTIGCACFTSCWALMLACVFAGHELWTMPCACAIGMAERYPSRPLRRSTFSLLISVTCVYAVLQILAAATTRA
jgi:predicted metal-binding membrane protein